MFYRYNEGKMNHIRTTNMYMRLYLLLTIGMIVGMIISYRSESEQIKKITKIVYKTKTVLVDNKDEFSEEKLKEFMLQINIKFPHIVFAQAKLESGNFTSSSFVKDNNIFGMKISKSRPTMRSGSNNGYAKFKTWKDCVIDYAFYQASYLKKIKTEEEYMLHLEENYAESPIYIMSLKKMIERND
jgi:uncharacterized FlgJ-related protein